MNIMREFRYKDIFANSAKIEEVMMRPFDGAEQEVGYRLMCYSDYDDGFYIIVLAMKRSQKHIKL